MSELGGLSREELIALVTAQAAEIAALRAVNAELAARLERLERLVSRNSANSSMPPSKDGEPGRTAPDEPIGGRPAGGGGRKRGKQRGAVGANLGWRPDPDERVDRFPEGRCECGAELGGASDLGVSDRFQQTEIPLVSATTTQYEHHTVRCGCGREHTAARPDGAGTGRVGYGGEPSSVVCVSDGGPRPAGAPVCGVAGVADRRDAVGGVRARHAHPGRGRHGAGRPADPYLDHVGVRGVL